MKWTPQKFNDTLALILMLLIFAIFGYALWASIALGYEMDGAGMILGALIAWGGAMVLFYYRKAPPPGGMEGGD